MKCPTCGTKVDFKAGRCPACGSEITEEDWKEYTEHFLDKNQDKIVDYIKNENVDRLGTILKEGLISPNQEIDNEYGYPGEELTLLHIAALEGSPNIVGLLIKAGGDIERKTKNNKTPLIYASQYKRTEVVKKLIRNGADVNAEDIFGCTPLIGSANCKDTDSIKLLVENGADCEIKDEDGKTPLLYFCSSNHNESESQIDTLRYLFDSRKRINEIDKKGNTPLHKACASCNKKIIDFLLKNGAKVNMQNDSGYTPLMEVVKSIYFKDGKEKRKKIFKIVKELLKRGSDPNVEDSYGEDAFELALESNNYKVALLLLEGGYGENFFKRKFKKVFGGFDKNNRIYIELSKETLLIKTTRMGRLKAMKKVIEIGGVDINTSDEVWGTPLVIATANGDRRIVKYLLENGARVNVKAARNNTPLILAARKGYYRIAEMLIRKGANLQSRGRYGRTALMEAASNGHFGIVKLLVEWGARINARDNSGTTALSRSYGNRKISNYLERNGGRL